MEKNSSKRSKFTGGIGFVMAAAASAVGLGNLWRFPYLAAQYGGGIFILVYLVLALTFGFALMTTEIAIGRKTKLSPTKAYQKVNKKFGFIGPLAFIIPVIILPYYCVIGGWVTKYVTIYITNEFKSASGETYFSNFISQEYAPLLFFLIFLVITALIVVLGVEKGIEKVSKVLMPLLIILAVAISVYVMTIPGALDGLKYYLLPDFSKFSFKTVCAAMGQMFYSMSLAMGIMITYGSYTRDDTSLVKSVNQIEIFDTLIALLAGMMVIPAVYVFSGEAGLKSGGAGLMFMTLPKVFSQMAATKIIGLLFFFLVFFAALTSAVSIMEAIVSMLMDRFKISRKRACLYVFIISVVLGIPSSLGNGIWANIKLLGMDFLTFFDYISNSVMLPIVALLTCVMIGWFTGTKYVTDEVTKNGEKFARKGIYEVVIKYIAPVLLVIILVFYTLAQFGVITL